MRVRMSKKQKTMAATYSKLGYGKPSMLSNGNMEVTKKDAKAGRMIVQVIDEHGATVQTRSRDAK